MAIAFGMSSNRNPITVILILTMRCIAKIKSVLYFSSISQFEKRTPVFPLFFFWRTLVAFSLYLYPSHHHPDNNPLSSVKPARFSYPPLKPLEQWREMPWRPVQFADSLYLSYFVRGSLLIICVSVALTIQYYWILKNAPIQFLWILFLINCNTENQQLFRA